MASINFGTERVKHEHIILFHMLLNGNPSQVVLYVIAQPLESGEFVHNLIIISFSYELQHYCLFSSLRRRCGDLSLRKHPFESPCLEQKTALHRHPTVSSVENKAT